MDRVLPARAHAALVGACLQLAVAATVLGGTPAHAAAVARAAAPAAHELQRALDAARSKAGAPGVAAAILADGKLVWVGQSGMADVRTREAVTPRTMFSLASVSKLFTTAIVMRLVEQGKLKLDDPIAPYVPGYVPDTRRVTVRELVAHTSGYPDDEDDPLILRELADPNFAWTRDDVLRRQPPVRSKPGARFDYCNSCYVMLGGVIERAGRASIADDFRAFVTAPLGLGDEASFDRLPAFASRIAHGYDVEKGKLVDTFAGARDLGVPTGVWGVVWTDGGVVATARGVAKFTDALFAGDLLSARSLHALMDAGPHHVYLGIESWRFDGRRWFGHSGYYSGFTTESWYDPARRVTITVLTNRTDAGDPATDVWHALTSTYDRLR